jgi:hypothetical protein
MYQRVMTLPDGNFQHPVYEGLGLFRSNRVKSGKKFTAKSTDI